MNKTALLFLPLFSGLLYAQESAEQQILDRLADQRQLISQDEVRAQLTITAK